MRGVTYDKMGSTVLCGGIFQLEPEVFVKTYSILRTEVPRDLHTRQTP
jgi:hypothetical protein